MASLGSEESLGVQERVIVFNVYQYLLKAKIENNLTYNVVDTTSEVTGVSVSSVFEIVKEAKVSGSAFHLFSTDSNKHKDTKKKIPVSNEPSDEEDIEELDTPSTSNEAENDNKDIIMKNVDVLDGDKEEENNSALNNVGDAVYIKQEEIFIKQEVEDIGDEQGNEDNADEQEGEDNGDEQEEIFEESTIKVENMDTEQGDNNGGSSDQPSDSISPKYYLISYPDMKNFLKYLGSIHSSEKFLCCHFCTYKPRIAENLEKHMVLKHPKIYCCKECEYCSTMELEIIKHTSVEHKLVEDKPYPCPHCPLRCVKEIVLKEHIKNVHERKNFPCPKCNLDFTSKVNLKAHYRSSHTVSCHYCKFYGEQMSTLRQHLLSEHKNEKPNLCQFCDFVAFRSPVLKKHLMSEHPDKMPYACSLCDFRTLHQSSLTGHITFMHPKQQLLKSQAVLALVYPKTLNGGHCSPPPPPSPEPEKKPPQSEDDCTYEATVGTHFLAT